MGARLSAKFEHFSSITSCLFTIPTPHVTTISFLDANLFIQGNKPSKDRSHNWGVICPFLCTSFSLKRVNKQ